MIMNKYIEVMKVYFKVQFIWRADVLFSVFFSVTRIIFAYLLWNAIFAGESMINGFSLNSMMSYYIIQSFLSQMDMSKKISTEISMSVRQGTFTKYLILPINTEGYFISMMLGKIPSYLVWDILSAMVWVLVFRIDFVFITNLSAIIGALCLIVLGFLFMIQLNFLLGILVFKYEEISTFLLIKDNVVLLVTGGIIPLALFPEWILNIMKMLPFYYITYLPSMIFIGQSCVDEIITGLIVMIFWCGMMQISIIKYWKNNVKMYDGVGI